MEAKSCAYESASESLINRYCQIFALVFAFGIISPDAAYRSGFQPDEFVR